MMQQHPSNQDKPKRGAPFKGDKPRKRYNFTLDPDVMEAARKLSESENVPLSELVERGLSLQLGK